MQELKDLAISTHCRNAHDHAFVRGVSEFGCQYTRQDIYE